MVSFTGPILKVGKSVTGVKYSKEVLIDLVDTFNAKYDNSGSVGQLSKVYPSPPMIDPLNISHQTVKLQFNNKSQSVIAFVKFFNNVKGLHLVKLFKNSPENVKMCPVLSGKTDEDNNALEANLVRIDFFYNNTIDISAESQNS